MRLSRVISFLNVTLTSWQMLVSELSGSAPAADSFASQAGNAIQKKFEELKKAPQGWTGGPIGSLTNETIAQILSEYEDVRLFQQGLLNFITDKDGAREEAVARAESILKRMADMKVLAQLAMDFSEPEFQARLWDKIGDAAETWFEEMERLFLRMFIPGTDGFASLSDVLGSKEGETVGIHLRFIKAYFDDFNGLLGFPERGKTGILSFVNHFFKGFFNEWALQLNVTYPKTIDKKSFTLEFEVQLAFEDISGAMLIQHGGMAAFDSFTLHRLVAVYHRNGKTKKTTFQGTKWLSIEGPMVHIESAFRGTNIPKKINYARFLIQPAQWAFEKFQTGQWGLPPGESLFDKFTPGHSEEQITEIKPEPSRNVTANGLYWNFLASSCATGEEIASGIGLALFNTYDITKMKKDNPLLLLGLLTSTFVGKVMGTMTGLSLAPPVMNATKGTAGLSFVHATEQLGTALADSALALVPMYAPYSSHAAVAFSWTSGYPLRHRSRAPLGHAKATDLLVKLAGSLRNPRAKSNSEGVTPLKLAAQVSLFFIFAAKPFGIDPPTQGK